MHKHMILSNRGIFGPRTLKCLARVFQYNNDNKLHIYIQRTLQHWSSTQKQLDFQVCSTRASDDLGALEHLGKNLTSTRDVGPGVIF